MLIKHSITDAFPIKGKLHIPDVLGMSVAHKLRSGTRLKCAFISPTGEQFEADGVVAFELINYKGRAENMDKIGGSLVFSEKPNGVLPLGWELFVHVEEF
ncbi:MAG TPA: hypothetical protein DCS87_06850 [Rheinheimera sp.]|nr:hypothetical protein [Rheinheimera sp.]